MKTRKKYTETRFEIFYGNHRNEPINIFTVNTKAPFQ
jgi:hypothetical protein